MKAKIVRLMVWAFGIAVVLRVLRYQRDVQTIAFNAHLAMMDYQVRRFLTSNDHLDELLDELTVDLDKKINDAKFWQQMTGD